MYSIVWKKRSLGEKVYVIAFISLTTFLVLIPSSFARGATPHSEEKDLVARMTNQLNPIMILGSLSYNIGTTSTHIYCNGNVTVSFSPTGISSGNGVYVAAYKVGNPVPVGGQFFDSAGSVTYNLYGYHYFVVEGTDSGISGTYTVSY